jgi:NADH:ubiquinone oxidoreductase subunit E
MRTTENPLDLHVFVCTNEKKDKECCARRGSEELRANLKNWAKQNPDWRNRVRINASGCLDHCTDGIAIAIFDNMHPGEKPQLLLNVDVADFDNVKRKIEEILSKPKSIP